ncbi:MAG: hypothetical protein H6739_21930 [Alphaproteobacteria bacterium]|nr:hypothetical protein [Alphaproteobacteria bacterium]
MRRALTLALALAWPGLASAIEIKPRRDKDLANPEVLVIDIGGFVQPRLVWVPEDERADTPGELGFAVRRARFEFSSRLAPQATSDWQFRHKLGFELMPEARLQDAYLDAAWRQTVGLRAGQFKAPTTRSLLTSDRNTLFPERGELVTLAPEREMGAMLYSTLLGERLDLYAGVFNGEGTNRLSNVNRKLLYVGRVELSPWGRERTKNELLKPGDRPWASVGYSFHYNVDGPPGQEHATVAHTADVYAYLSYVTVQAEFLYGISDWEDVNIADSTSYGFYGQAGLFIFGVPWVQDHIAALARYEQIDRFVPDERFDTALNGPTDPNQARRSVAFGLGYYVGPPRFERAQDMRVTVTYELKQELEGLEYDNNELLVAAHMSF